LLGRCLAGAFGGVAASLVLAIVGDAFPPARRATVLSVVMSAFSVAAIVGIPLGLRLAGASAFGWRTPFAVLAGCGALVLPLAWLVLPSIRHHLARQQEKPAAIPLWEVLSRPGHLCAFLMAFLVVSFVMCLVPYLALILERNVGCSRREIELVYLVGGLTTLAGTNVTGRLADRFSRRLVFRLVVLASLVPVGALSVLPAGTSLFWALLVSTAYIVLSSARLAPAMALITGAAEPQVRGRFMSLISAVQQLAAGTAPLVSGLILCDSGPGQPLGNLPLVGLLSASLGVASVFLVGWLRPAPGEGIAPSPNREAGGATSGFPAKELAAGGNKQGCR
jgi:predicted MFS family arabinose efflux permease